MAVSKKDLARVNLGRKRQEKIKVMALTKWKAKVPVGTTIYNHGQEKPEEYMFRGKLVSSNISHADKDVVQSDNCKMRSSADKVARFHVKRSDNFSDYADAPAISEPKAPLPKVVTPRADSPFKRPKRAVVVEYK